MSFSTETLTTDLWVVLAWLRTLSTRQFFVGTLSGITMFLGPLYLVWTMIWETDTVAIASELNNSTISYSHELAIRFDTRN
jgi:hypothetical protein